MEWKRTIDAVAHDTPLYMCEHRDLGIRKKKDEKKEALVLTRIAN